MLALIEQPTSWALEQVDCSRHRQPSAVQMWVESAIHFWFGRSATNGRFRRFTPGRGQADRLKTIDGRGGSWVKLAPCLSDFAFWIYSKNCKPVHVVDARAELGIVNRFEQELVMRPVISALLAVITTQCLGAALAQKLVDPDKVAPEYREAAEKRRQEQIKVLVCSKKVDDAKILRRDRIAEIQRCLDGG